MRRRQGAAGARCFNGAALFRARRLGFAVPEIGNLKLQRGRALSSAEAQTPWPLRARRGRASTGPRSFERGGSASTGSAGPAGRLQRGRALSSAEALLAASTCSSPSCFNGAALFRARRPLFPAPTSLPWSRFNGAALFRARRPPLRRLPRPRLSCFNGAALFRARRRKCRPGQDPELKLQRGRALSSAEAQKALAARVSSAEASTGPRSFERGGAALLGLNG